MVDQEVNLPVFLVDREVNLPVFLVDQEVNLPEKRRPRRFIMVDQEVNLPEKSGVVTAEITFTLCTNTISLSYIQIKPFKIS